jgi:hypothetical protein
MTEVLNDLYSGASSQLRDLKFNKVIDPRSDIDKERYYTIDIGASKILQTQLATSGNANATSLSYSFQPSESSILDRRFLNEYKANLAFDVQVAAYINNALTLVNFSAISYNSSTAGQASTMPALPLWSGRMAPRAFPYNSAIQNATLGLNNTQFDTRPMDYVNALMASCDVNGLSQDILSTTPFFPDQYGDYIGAFNVKSGASLSSDTTAATNNASYMNNPLLPYGDASLTYTRGGYTPDAYFKPGSDGKLIDLGGVDNFVLNTTAADQVAQTFVVQYNFVEPLAMGLSPLLWTKQRGPGLTGISSVKIDIKLSKFLERFFSIAQPLTPYTGQPSGTYAIPSGATYTANSVTSPVFYILKQNTQYSGLLGANLLYNEIKPDGNITEYRPSKSYYYPYNFLDVNSSTGSSGSSLISPGASASLSWSSSLGGTPSYIIVYPQVDRNNAAYNATSSDTFGLIKNLNIKIDVEANQLSNMTTAQLWDMSSKNSLKVPFVQGKYQTGYPIIIKVGEDLQLPRGFVPGTAGSMPISVTAQVQNITGSTKPYTLYVVLLNEGVLSIKNKVLQAYQFPLTIGDVSKINIDPNIVSTTLWDSSIGIWGGVAYSQMVKNLQKARAVKAAKARPRSASARRAPRKSMGAGMNTDNLANGDDLPLMGGAKKKRGTSRKRATSKKRAGSVKRSGSRKRATSRKRGTSKKRAGSMKRAPSRKRASSRRRPAKGRMPKAMGKGLNSDVTLESLGIF